MSKNSLDMDDLFDEIKEKASVGGIILLLIGTIFFLPWVTFWICYFGGWVAKIVIGKYLVAGFAILGIKLPIDNIPLIAGCLGWIGSFFKNSSVSKKE